MAKGEERAMSTDWVPGVGTGFFGSIVAWLLSWRVAAARSEGKADADALRIQDRDEGFREDIRSLRDELRAGVTELRAVSSITAKLQASQDVVNQVTAKSLEAIVAKQDQHAEKLADHTSAIKLLTELIVRHEREERKQG
jgi:chromatin segregation and condensation protein Rec8/ScpA/Scc1 (kleisin family)